MTVKEALSARRSVRAYKPDRIDAAVLAEILGAAERAPSWANTQPWQVFVAQGETLGRIRAAYLENYRDKVPGHPEVERPAQWTEETKRRQKALRPGMARDCGEAADQFAELNNRLFDAPAVIYVCVEKALSHWSLFDLGSYCQSIMLLAPAYGLATIPAITTVNFPDVLHRELDIPDTLSVAIGVAIGYADTGNAINNFRSEREDINSVVKYLE